MLKRLFSENASILNMFINGAGYGGKILFQLWSDRQAGYISIALNNVNLGSPWIEARVP